MVRRWAVTYLDDQDAIFGEEAGCIMQDRYHRIQTVNACRKPERWFVGKFAGEPRHIRSIHIGWIADDKRRARSSSADIF